MSRRRGVAENSIYRWKAKYGGMGVSDAKLLRELDAKNRRLKHMLGEVTLRPRDGVLWAYPALNAKGLTEASPLHINVVAGARFALFRQRASESA